MEEKFELLTESASLSESVLYKSFNSTGAITTLLTNSIKDSITIDSSYLQEQILSIKRTKISPLSEKVLDAFTNDDIEMIYTNNKKVPQMIPFFGTKISGKIKVIIIGNNYGSIVSSDTNSSDKYFNIQMKNLYVLLEGAYCLFKFLSKPYQVKKNLGLMRVTMSIYTNMILRIFNKEYAISMDQELYDKVSFFISLFFLKNVWGSDNNDVNISYAYSILNNTDRNMVQAYLVEYNEMKIEGIDDLMKALSTLSPRLKSLTFRYFTQCYINTYKAPALFGVEYLPMFLFTIQTSMIGSFIVNQPIISDITKNVKNMNIFYPELSKALI